MKWITIKNEKPPPKEYVLLYANNGTDKPSVFVGIRGYWDNDEYSCAHGDGYLPFEVEQITHWSKLPNPPDKPPYIEE